MPAGEPGERGGPDAEHLVGAEVHPRPGVPAPLGEQFAQRVGTLRRHPGTGPRLPRLLPGHVHVPDRPAAASDRCPAVAEIDRRQRGVAQRQEELAFGGDGGFAQVHLHELAGPRVRPDRAGPFEVALDLLVHPGEAEVGRVEPDARLGIDERALRKQRRVVERHHPGYLLGFCGEHLHGVRVAEDGVPTRLTTLSASG